MEFRTWIESAISNIARIRPKPTQAQIAKITQWIEANEELLKGKRIHTSNEPVTNLQDRTQTIPPGYFRVNGKPFGFWYAFGADWINFALFEHQGAINPMIYEVDVNPSRILVLNDRTKQDEFEKQFGVWSDFQKHGWYDQHMGTVKHSKRVDGQWHTTDHPSVIDWNLVGRHYDGVEIDVDELSGIGWADSGDWSVNSGCVWNKNGIRNLKLLADLR